MNVHEFEFDKIVLLILWNIFCSFYGFGLYILQNKTKIHYVMAIRFDSIHMLDFH